jgi:hypothetical protein
MSVPWLARLPAIVDAERTGPEVTGPHRPRPMIPVTDGM